MSEIMTFNTYWFS